MAQTLPEGAYILPADMDRIEAAMKSLETTQDAHSSVAVKVNLHIHYEYPKHLTVGDKTVVVKSHAEELAALAPPAKGKAMYVPPLPSRFPNMGRRHLPTMAELNSIGARLKQSGSALSSVPKV